MSETATEKKQAEMRPISAVIGGVQTKSAKIRALAEGGYLRSNIAKILDIKYQHVRKVLEDSGSREGLLREAVSTAAPKPKRTSLPLTVELLIAAGFQHLGAWTSTRNGIALEVPAPKNPGVYAFSVNGIVQYVGVTQNTFYQRMDQYRRGHHGQKTNARIKPVIEAVLMEGRTVKIYIASPEITTWNGLPVNTAAGLEEGLIRLYSLPWNVKGSCR